MRANASIITATGIWLWPPLISTIILGFVVVLLLGFDIRWSEWTLSLFPVGAGGVAAALLARRGFVRVGAYFTAIFQIVTALAAEMIWVYPAAVINGPLADGIVMHADRIGDGTRTLLRDTTLHLQ